MVGAIGFEFWGRRSFNNIERTAGTVQQWKAVVNSANGSPTDHGAVILKSANEGGRNIDVLPCRSLSGKVQSVWPASDRPSRNLGAGILCAAAAAPLARNRQRLRLAGTLLLVSLIREFQDEDSLRLRLSGFEFPLLYCIQRVLFKDRVSSNHAGGLYCSVRCDDDLEPDFASYVHSSGKLRIARSGFGNHLPRNFLRYGSLKKAKPEQSEQQASQV
jgi:hypothetical protein